jgi:hypothetical protein
MNWDLLIPLLVTTVVAVLGWFFAHRFAASRDRQNKRRETRVGVLIEAYRALEFSANRIYDAITAPPVEKALSDIQLLGTRQQVELSQALIEQLGREQQVDWQPLLLDLRDDLRSELRLEPVQRRILHSRFIESSIRRD